MTSRKLETSNPLPTILLIEDELELQEEMQGLLESLGYKVVVAGNERQSQEVLSQANSRVDLILVNQRKPSEEVLELGRRIRESEHVASNAPLVVIPFEFIEANEGKNFQVGEREYTSYFSDWIQLENLLTSVLPVR